MTSEEDKLIEEYRKQIDRWTLSLSVAKNEEVTDSLAPGMTLELVKMFTDGNLDKRYNKIKDQLEIVADGFDETDFDDIVADYVKFLPLAAYDTGCSDGERFLEWLLENFSVTPEQMDRITCQRTRHAVEFVAREHRMDHIRFQELLSMVEFNRDEWGENENLFVHLNPIHVWTTFETHELLDEEDEVPARVLFYAVGADIRTAVLESEGAELVETLSRTGRVRLEELHEQMFSHSREEVIEICRDMADIGLAAFG